MPDHSVAWWNVENLFDCRVPRTAPPTYLTGLWKAQIGCQLHRGWESVEAVAKYHAGKTPHLRRGGVESIAYTFAIRREGQIVLCNDFREGTLVAEVHRKVRRACRDLLLFPRS